MTQQSTIRFSHWWLFAFILFILLAISTIVTVAFGSTPTSWQDIKHAFAIHLHFEALTAETSSTKIIWDLRFPRSLLAAITGAGLAIAGVILQTLVRNPLAEPYLLGVSSGAAVGATAVITTGAVAGIGLSALTGGAFVGAVLSTVILYLLSMIQGGITPSRLILTGVILSSALNALASFLIFRAQDARAANSVLFWLLGSVAGANWNKLTLPFIIVLLAVALFCIIGPYLDLLSAGEDLAVTAGVNVKKLRACIFLASSLLIGILVAFTGGIGFVGLIVPHLARQFVGAIHRRLLPVSALLGAIFLVWVDVLARLIAPPQEIPIGVVTGILGAPLFLFLLGRKNITEDNY